MHGRYLQVEHCLGISSLLLEYEIVKEMLNLEHSIGNWGLEIGFTKSTGSCDTLIGSWPVHGDVEPEAIVVAC